MRFVVNLVHAMGSAAISESQNHVERLSHHPVMKDIERPDVFLSHSPTVAFSWSQTDV